MTLEIESIERFTMKAKLIVIAIALGLMNASAAGQEAGVSMREDDVRQLRH